MRGKGYVATRQVKESRITPAHAGKSNYYKTQQNLCNGSPPHMRGKEISFPLLRKGDGITPAHARKSCKTFALNNWEQDHPRTCGEKADSHKSR